MAGYFQKNANTTYKPDEHQICWAHTYEENAGILQALDQIDSKDAGINFPRIKRFLQSKLTVPYALTLNPPRTLFFNKHDTQSIRTLANIVLDAQILELDLHGAYYPDMHTVIILRDPLEEQLNGIGITEAITVHEIVHTTERVIKGKKGLFHSVSNNGLLGYNAITTLRLDEAVCDYYYGMYVQDLIDRDAWPCYSAIKEKWGNIMQVDENGFAHKYPTDTPSPTPLAVKYYSLAGGTPDTIPYPYINYSCFYAQALEFMFAMGITDMQTVLGVRNADYDAFDLLKKQFTTVHPKLFYTWFSPYTEDEQLYHLMRDLIKQGGLF